MAAEFPQVTFTRLTSAGGNLTKSYILSESGEIIKGARPDFTDGTAEVMTVPLDQITADQVQSRSYNIYGIPSSEPRPDGRWNVKTRTSAASRPAVGTIARTKDEFKFSSGPGVLLLDNDSNPDASPPIQALTGAELMAILEEIMPGASSSAFLATPSASAGIVIAATGSPITGKGGVHLYLPVADASDIERFGKVLFQRLWLTGHGSIEVDPSGWTGARRSYCVSFMMD